MLFNSFEFMIFLPVVFLLYWFVFRGRRWQNMLVLVASYVFYGWWDWRFLPSPRYAAMAAVSCWSVLKVIAAGSRR